MNMWHTAADNHTQSYCKYWNTWKTTTVLLLCLNWW